MHRKKIFFSSLLLMIVTPTLFILKSLEDSFYTGISKSKLNCVYNSTLIMKKHLHISVGYGVKTVN